MYSKCVQPKLILIGQIVKMVGKWLMADLFCTHSPPLSATCDSSYKCLVIFHHIAAFQDLEKIMQTLIIHALVL